MSATKIPIEFPKTSTATEHGDGVLIHWTTTNETRRRAVCASIEGTRQPSKRMVKYLREGGR